MRRLVSRLKALGSGQMPLREAFWDWAVFWGLLINLAGSALSLVVIVLSRHTGAAEAIKPLAPALVLALHLLPLPYNLLFVVGVWRSAGHAGIPSVIAGAARLAVIALFSLFLVI